MYDDCYLLEGPLALGLEFLDDGASSKTGGVGKTVQFVKLEFNELSGELIDMF